MKVVWVQYLVNLAAAAPAGLPTSKRHPFPFLWSEDVPIGTYVIVPSQRPYSVGIVVERPEDYEDNIENKKWIVQILDDTEYKQRVEREARSEEIMVELRKRAEKVTMLSRYEEIAKNDPEAKALMVELQSLQGT